MSNTIIQLKSSGAVGNVPSSLSPGEIAINYADGKLYYGNTACNSVLFNSGITEPAGLNQEIQFNDSGSFGSSANLKFNVSTETLTTKNVAITFGGSITFPDNTVQTTAWTGATSTNIDSIARDVSNLAFDQANTATNLAQSAYNYANTITSVGVSPASDYFPTGSYGFVTEDFIALVSDNTFMEGEMSGSFYDCRNDPIIPRGFYLRKDLGFLV